MRPITVPSTLPRVPLPRGSCRARLCCERRHATTTTHPALPCRGPVPCCPVVGTGWTSLDPNHFITLSETRNRDRAFGLLRLVRERAARQALARPLGALPRWVLAGAGPRAPKRGPRPRAGRDAHAEWGPDVPVSLTSHCGLGRGRGVDTCAIRVAWDSCGDPRRRTEAVRFEDMESVTVASFRMAGSVSTGQTLGESTPLAP